MAQFIIYCGLFFTVRHIETSSPAYYTENIWTRDVEKRCGVPDGSEVDVSVRSGWTGGHGVLYAGESCFPGAAAGGMYSSIW